MLVLPYFAHRRETASRIVDVLALNTLVGRPPAHPPAPSLALLPCRIPAACGQLVMTPMQVAHTRMLAGTTNAGIFGAMAEVYADGGMYTGIGPSLVLTCNPAINYMLFDRLKASYLAWKQRQAAAAAAAAATNVEPGFAKRSSNAPQQRARPSPPSGAQAQPSLGVVSPAQLSTQLSSFEAFAVGMAAKMAATVLTYPLIRAKTVLQSGVTESKSLFLVALQLLKQEGFQGWFRGLKPMLVNAMLGGALMVMGKEKIQQIVSSIVAGGGTDKKCNGCLRNEKAQASNLLSVVT